VRAASDDPSKDVKAPASNLTKPVTYSDHQGARQGATGAAKGAGAAPPARRRRVATAPRLPTHRHPAPPACARTPAGPTIQHLDLRPASAPSDGDRSKLVESYSSRVSLIENAERLQEWGIAPEQRLAIWIRRLPDVSGRGGRGAGAAGGRLGARALAAAGAAAPKPPIRQNSNPATHRPLPPSRPAPVTTPSRTCAW
jgi:hypothetical protein